MTEIGRASCRELVTGVQACALPISSVAEKDLLSIMPVAARSAFRPRAFTKLRKYADASFSTLAFMIGSISLPDMKTGWAAPVLVPSAIAATSDDRDRKSVV